MGATDLCHSLESVDHWAETGLDTNLMPVCMEQHWLTDAKSILTQAFADQTGRPIGSGPAWRGRGWRLWFANGLCITSRMTRWEEVPDGIVLGVSYCGYRRWLVQGNDPYWRGADRLLYDSRTPENTCAPMDTIRRMGIWVTDEEMRYFRWLAALAFVL